MAPVRISYHTGADSPMARLDPRVKLLYIAWVLGMIVVFSSPLFQSFVVLTIAAGIVFGRLRPAAVVSAGRIGLFAGLASWALWILFVSEGSVVARLGPIRVTDAGIVVGLSAAVRITSVLFAFLIVAMTTPTRDIIVALYRLRLPIVFAMVIGLVLRLIPQFQAEHAIIVEAQMSRGAEFDRGHLFARFRKHTSYVIPLSLRALKIVSDMSTALEARAFDPYARRTFVRHLALRRLDRALLIAMAASLLIAILVRVAGHGGVGGPVPGFGQ